MVFYACKLALYARDTVEYTSTSGTSQVPSFVAFPGCSALSLPSFMYGFHVPTTKKLVMGAEILILIYIYATVCAVHRCG
jgi:hypothetical protein